MERNLLELLDCESNVKTIANTLRQINSSPNSATNQIRSYLNELGQASADDVQRVSRKYWNSI